VILSVSFVSYLGAFSGEYRKNIVFGEWIPAIQKYYIVCNEQFSLQKALGNPLTIQNWVLNGLPLDDVSKENAIIMSHSVK